ncbi:MAG: division/cell wall cluster transcriptional repressor MraZ [Novosphingobium sp. 28-62-57]|uniref:division/cell wall cluster transcriptional repressor MraZ n=1 Tax=unclassified Novosphingobium TaxID=2644732 RepID=UPI000BD42C1C|nr:MULTISPECIES: division/cell wall cluster transcriptional repressor MraZ [unclassified Novosphingobium]OYW50941.1 MAG: division/cell wall cluster transcriptional repressor MraZ [Novosphingobium sp. 12-62-10]OYZ10108.1 MAG: division/cell wall cluster transcriptional repressor MraZ [Novosphingobium sp. 28-62-57]
MTGGSVNLVGQGFSPRGEKGRFVLPADFRSDIFTASANQRVLCLDKHPRLPCLTGFGLSRLADFAAEIDREEEKKLRLGLDFDRDAAEGQVYGFTRVSYDDSGRFVLPDYLSELGQVEDGLYFHGGGRQITIWNPRILFEQDAAWAIAQAGCRAKMAEAAKGKRK